MSASAMQRLGADRGPEFYLMALQCAQSLWQQGLPSQSLLLIDRAMGADLSAGDEVLENFPMPYAAVRWILENRKEDQFIGNPRLHFQHLATRMAEPRKTVRTWRAWACWWIARQVNPDWPADELQIREENLTEPTSEEIFAQLQQWGLPGEADLWQAAVTHPAVSAG